MLERKYRVQNTVAREASLRRWHFDEDLKGRGQRLGHKEKHSLTRKLQV